MDAITRETILRLTTRIADLEAGLEVHRNLIKEMMQAQATLRNSVFIPAAFDLRVAEATAEQRERMAAGNVQPPVTVGAPVYLEMPGET